MDWIKEVWIACMDFITTHSLLGIPLVDIIFGLVFFSIFLNIIGEPRKE